jgi:hypothetical protein
MRYPIFHFDDKTVTFVPRGKKMDDNFVDQLTELEFLCNIKYPFYVFIGTEKVLVVDRQPATMIDVLFEIPDTHDLIHFTSVDDTQCTIVRGKKTKPEFKLQMQAILSEMSATLEMIFIEVPEVPEVPKTPEAT